MSTAEPVLYDGEPPPIWLWYRIYAVSMGLLNGFVASILVGLLMLTGFEAMSGDDMSTFIIAIAMCGPLSIAYLIAPFLPRAPWAWMYHMIAICLPMTSPCCMPIGIPLIMYWTKPETRAFFGKVD